MGRNDALLFTRLECEMNVIKARQMSVAQLSKDINVFLEAKGFNIPTWDKYDGWYICRNGIRVYGTGNFWDLVRIIQSPKIYTDLA